MNETRAGIDNQKPKVTVWNAYLLKNHSLLPQEDLQTNSPEGTYNIRYSLLELPSNPDFDTILLFLLTRIPFENTDFKKAIPTIQQLNSPSNAAAVVKLDVDHFIKISILTINRTLILGDRALVKTLPENTSNNPSTSA